MTGASTYAGNMKFVAIQWQPRLALGLVVPVALPIAGLFLAGAEASVIIALVVVAAGLLGAMGGPCTGCLTSIGLGLSFPAAALFAAVNGYAPPQATRWLADGMLVTVLALLATTVAAALRFAVAQWLAARLPNRRVSQGIRNDPLS